MRLFSKYIIIMMLNNLLFMTTSCNLHEFPELNTTVDIILRLNFDSELPLHELANLQQSSTEYNVRHTINIYKNELSNNNFSRIPNSTLVITHSLSESLNQSIPLQLEQANYQFIIFTDYIDKGEITDKFYKTNDFAEIFLINQENYIANNNYKETFKGKVIETVDNSKYDITISMERPQAIFEIITTDLDLFISNILEKNDLDTIDISNYRVIVRYVGFMPASFNLFSDRPADAWQGIYFKSSIEKITDSEARLGFDYLFVGPTSSSVSLLIEVYDTLGQKISQTGTLEVPVVRSKLTTVKGEFLTSKASGGISLNTEFYGEWNYEVN